MKKIIITGDIHFKGINPIGRLDNYQEALTRKIHEVFEIAVREKAEAIIIPGDIFDSPATTLSTISDLASLFQLAPCPLLTIPGNHDLWAANPGSKFRTPFGLLARLGLIFDLTESPFLLGDHTVITGSGYSIETDTEAGMGQFNAPDLVRTKIHVVHSMLMSASPGYEMRHTLINQVKTNANIIVSGHYHTGFGLIERQTDQVVFINPGALCRTSASQTEIERQVQVVVLEIYDNGLVSSAELIPLRSALPGREVLSREHLEEAAAKTARLENFFALLASEGATKFMEVRDIVEDIAARDAIPEVVKREALRRIDLAREELEVA